MYQIRAKECEIRHDWAGKVISLELCKKLKFEYTNKWYMHNPESVLVNEMLKILWNVKKQTRSENKT